MACPLLARLASLALTQPHSLATEFIPAEAGAEIMQRWNMQRDEQAADTESDSESRRTEPREQSASGGPGATAAASLSSCSYTYLSMCERVVSAARVLRGVYGVCRGSWVGVFMEPHAELIPALLAVLAAGAAYVPMDTAWPAARIKAVWEQANQHKDGGQGGQRSSGTCTCICC